MAARADQNSLGENTRAGEGHYILGRHDRQSSTESTPRSVTTGAGQHDNGSISTALEASQGQQSGGVGRGHRHRASDSGNGRAPEIPSNIPAVSTPRALPQSPNTNVHSAMAAERSPAAAVGSSTLASVVSPPTVSGGHSTPQDTHPSPNPGTPAPTDPWGLTYRRQSPERTAGNSAPATVASMTARGSTVQATFIRTPSPPDQNSEPDPATRVDDIPVDQVIQGVGTLFPSTQPTNRRRAPGT